MTTDDLTPVQRTAGRVFPVDDSGRVLLLQVITPHRPDAPFWCTIGGGVEPGETERDAAARELAEETGIVVAAGELIGPVASENVRFRWDRWDVSQQQSLFAVAVGNPVVSLDGLDRLEADTTLGYRWWGADELLASGEPAVDHVLASLADAVAAVRGDRPSG